jgi:8-amino-7-oxononanoate synthase
LNQPVTAVAGPRVRIGGAWVLNLASSDYLGLTGHPAARAAACRAAETWGLSLSQPRLWAGDALSATLERKLAYLVGQEQALLFPSTRQLAHDVLPLLAGEQGAIFIDEKAYPISQEGARAARGAVVKTFTHNDPGDLARELRLCRRAERVIVVDGFYMDEGQPAALAAFARLAERFDAVIYIDDAQGIGMLGHDPTLAMPYGWGGGGAPAYCGVGPGRIVHAATLAKAFGTPVAFVAGPKQLCEHLRANAFSVIHSSPPALPVVAAGLAAVRLHAVEGDTRRQRLLRLVRLFRAGMDSDRVSDHEFPMQSLYFDTVGAAAKATSRLRRRGIWTVVQFDPEDNPDGGAIRLLFTARHEAGAVEWVIAAVNEVIGRSRTPTLPRRKQLA